MSQLEEYRDQIDAVDRELVELFCRRGGFAFGSVLCIGSGEAILRTPFAFLAKRRIAQLAKAAARGRQVRLKTAMPLPKKLFLQASEKYWASFGARYGVTPEQLRTMQLEGE